MNTFFFDPCPYVSAQMMDDKRVGKMIIESGQLFTACIRITLADNGFTDEEIEALMEEYGIVTSKGTTWRITHRNHPSSLWCREAYENASWVIHHALGLINQFTIRYGKVHGCAPAIAGMFRLLGDILKPMMMPGMTKPPQCMPDVFKHRNPCIAYQQYHYSKPNVHWRQGVDAPDWWQRVDDLEVTV